MQQFVLLMMSKELKRNAKRGGSQECPTTGACKELVKHAPLSMQYTASFDSLDEFLRLFQRKLLSG